MNTNQPNQPQTPTSSSPGTINTPSFTQTPVQPQTHKKKTPWLLITIIVLLLSATGVLGYKYYQFKKIPFDELTYEDYLLQEESLKTAQIDISSNPFGREIKLEHQQIVNIYPSKETDNQRITLRITDYIDDGCPKGWRCFWSGLDVHYELTVGDQVYNHPGSIIDAPYKVTLIDSNYKTWAIFVIDKKNKSS